MFRYRMIVEWENFVTANLIYQLKSLSYQLQVLMKTNFLLSFPNRKQIKYLY